MRARESSPSRASRSRICALIPTRSAWLGAMTPVRSRISGESFNHRAATAPAMFSGLTSATLPPSFSNACLISPARLASTAAFRSGFLWRMIWSMVAIGMPAPCNWANALPASTASSCFSSPTNTTLGSRSDLAIRNRSRICTVEASEASSTTRTDFENAARMVFAPLPVRRPSAIPAFRARNRCSVSLSMPASAASVLTAEADGASPISRYPFFSASARARRSMVVLPVPA